ncbi:SDR family NAD(P)-dependent oxidoreductase [Bradyrhizobium tropiciagri]|uniref:SDR family NAD(P)-dependent oxidoreductase n=1 Tax=Bradyrhizobium tropiciagri TaxID=312253 RepID=UPI00067C2F3D|nr:SDR family oxidoreductase [Bradyrhizobium tropiciagri]
MDLKLKGRTALVTGASSGIGAGVARELAKEGVRLALNAFDAEQLHRVISDIGRSTDQEPVLLAGDLTDPKQLHRIVGEARAALGEIQILASCAGGSRPTSLDEDEAFWDEAMALNFQATRRIAQALLPDMRRSKWGRIVSISGSMEPRTLNAASVAKGAMHLWAKGLSCDVAAEGITVNCIAPGRINSVQTLTRLHPTEEARREFIAKNIPAGEFGEPEDIGRVVTFLSSPLARYITGAVIPVDGGMHYFAH